MVSTSALPQGSTSASGYNSGAAGARRGHVSRRFDGKEDPAPKASVSIPSRLLVTLTNSWYQTPSLQQPEIEVSASTDADEAAKIAAMFATTNSDWKDTQEKMSTLVLPASRCSLCSYSHVFRRATPVFFGGRRPGGGPRPAHASAAPDKPVPPNYICYRCGQAGELCLTPSIVHSTPILTFRLGHWIQDCPTNDKPEWDNKPRMKRTTGIPKSFLQTVEGPSKDGENQAGLMISSDGGFVIAKPDA